MSRWRTGLVLLGLALATPLLTGCLTTIVVKGVVHALKSSGEHKSKDDADGSHTKKHESKQRPDSAPQRQEPAEQPESPY
jgi:hypothetical protein